MSDVVLVINAGSSSLKYSLVDAGTGRSTADGLVERIGEPGGRIRHSGPNGVTVREREVGTHEDALRAVLALFASEGPSLDETDLAAIGHRVVHGGSIFAAPALIGEALLTKVTELIPLAPLHNAANLEGMEVAQRLFPDIPQVAVFDTAFHQTLPEHAYTYAVPYSWREEHKIRRYGFHGTSHAFVSRAAADLLGKTPEEANLIVLHLGNGASATAVRGGRSVDTSMGLTPLEGLVMGTRSGDLDPALHGHLHRQLGWSLKEIDDALNRASGLKGLSGVNDFRELIALVDAGDGRARLAFDVYCYRAKKYVGSYYAALGTVDAIVFTGGVGQNSPRARAGILGGLEPLGICLDEATNDNLKDPSAKRADQTSADQTSPDQTSPAQPATDGPRVISTPDSRVAVLVIPTNEEWEIARQSLAVVR